MKPCTGAAQHEGGGQTELYGGWGYPRWKELAQGPVLFLARGRGLCWPAAKWPTGASWCRAGGQELAPTPTGTGLRLQLVSQGTQLAGTPKTERLIFLWTIYNFTFFFFYYFSISCQYWITVHYPRVIIFYHWIRPLKASSDCALLYTDIHGPPPLPRNVIVTA